MKKVIKNGVVILTIGYVLCVLFPEGYKDLRALANSLYKKGKALYLETVVKLDTRQEKNEGGAIVG